MGRMKGEEEEEKQEKEKEEEGEVWEKTSEEEPVLSLTSSLSTAGDILLAPKTQAQLRSQLDLNPSINGRDFQVSRKCPLGCWGGWVHRRQCF